MGGLAWGAWLGLLTLLGPVAGARADSAGELGERLRRATAVLGEMASGKEDADVLLGGRYSVPAGAQSFVKVLTAYSPPPRKR